jgi:hypothetical protein
MSNVDTHVVPYDPVEKGRPVVPGSVHHVLGRYRGC